jgi:hypothetical protein
VPKSLSGIPSKCNFILTPCMSTNVFCISFKVDCKTITMASEKEDKIVCTLMNGTLDHNTLMYSEFALTQNSAFFTQTFEIGHKWKNV